MLGNRSSDKRRNEESVDKQRTIRDRYNTSDRTRGYVVDGRLPPRFKQA